MGTSQELLSQAPRAWGAYFDRVNGDFLFSSWAQDAPNHMYVDQGFSPPPVVD